MRETNGMSQPALRHRSAESADTDYLVSQSRQPLFATTGISPGNQPQPGGRYWGTLRAAASRQSNRDSDRQELADSGHRETVNLALPKTKLSTQSDTECQIEFGLLRVEPHGLTAVAFCLGGRRTRGRSLLLSRGSPYNG